MSKRWFVYDPGDGFETYATAEEAKEGAETALDQYRDNAPEGWAEEVAGVCWGEIKGQVIQTVRIHRDQAVLDEEGYDAEGRYWDGDWDEWAEYQLLDIEGPL